MKPRRCYPAHLGGLAFAALVLQFIVAVFLASGLALFWRTFHQAPGLQNIDSLPVALWCSAAIAAAFGIFYNRWWAHFLELPVFWGFLFVQFAGASPPKKGAEVFGSPLWFYQLNRFMGPFPQSTCSLG
jgi:hypothetical protein